MRRAFVIGNAAWDETLHVAALPAPGASIHARLGAAGPGGKGANQAATLARAGIPVTFLAAIGDDVRGEALASALEVEGLARSLLRRDGVATDWSLILVAEDGTNAVVTTREAAASMRAADIAACLLDARPGDLCILQGNLDPDATEAAVALATGRGALVALNPSPSNPRLAPLIPRADALFLNTDEAMALTGTSGPEALRELRRRGAGCAVLTLGAKGALLATEAGTAEVPAQPADAVDPTAAGDVFMAVALAHAAPRGWLPDIPALQAGARAASLTVARPGAFTALPSREELSAIMSAG